MSMDFAAAGGLYQPDTQVDKANGKTQAEMAARSRSAPETEEKSSEKSSRSSAVEEIRKKGFFKYIEDLEKRKIEELRQKILTAMGLSETDLANMSPDQRQVLEGIISRDIQKRMMLASNMKDNDDQQGGAFVTNGSNASLVAMIASGSTDMSLPPLLNVQEIDEKDGEQDPEKR